jgi:hypothetical protein
VNAEGAMIKALNLFPELIDNVSIVSVLTSVDEEGGRYMSVGVMEKRTEVEAIKKDRRIVENEAKAIGILSKKMLLGRNGVESYLLKNKEVPIDIVVDLSLISKEDLAENVETWAYLIMMTREHDNVNFTFEYPNGQGKLDLSSELAQDIDNAPSVLEVVRALEVEIESKVLGLGLDDRVKSSIVGRINAGRRANAVEIPITSKEWLKHLIRVKEQGLGLKENQYPVAMEEPAFIEGKGIALMNFEAALAIGLSKAALVIANDKGEFDEFISDGRLLTKLNELYEAMPRKQNEPLTKETLANMISSTPMTRLNVAISLALPPITRNAVRMLRELHENIQLALMAA